MKTKILCLSILIIVIGLHGCVTSLHPLYTSDKLIFDNRLVGSWKEPGSNDVWKLENLLEKNLDPYKDKRERADKERFKRQFINPNTYLLTYTENGEVREFNASLLKLDNNLFLDLSPGSLNLKSSFFEDHFLPVHTYAKIKVYDDRFELYFFNSELLYKLLNQNNIRIKHESFNYYKVITASTEELQKFVEKYADRKNLFLEPVVMKKSS
jgi:ribosome-associated translation inhibitor RaiA